MSKDLKKQRKSLDKKKEKQKGRFKGHGVQFRVPEAQEMYAPARDFAHNYPVMINSIIRAFSSDYWPELFGWLVKEYQREFQQSGRYTTSELNNFVYAEIAFDDLEAAKDIYCNFLSHCCDNPDETVGDVLAKVGWNDVSTNVQMTWFSMMGQVMTGQLFAGIRDLTMAGGKGGKMAEVMHFIEEGHKARRVLNGLSESAEIQNQTREMVRACRKSGMTFDQISELVKDVELGRV